MNSQRQIAASALAAVFALGLASTSVHAQEKGKPGMDRFYGREQIDKPLPEQGPDRDYGIDR